MKEYPVINHMLLVGKPGSYKDVTAVMLCYEAWREQNTPIVSNIELSFPHVFLEKMSQMQEIRGDVWNPSMLFIHDSGFIFNSRQFAERKGKASTDARKMMVNNWRKRAINFLGSVHREMEIDVDIRRMVSYFLYPEVERYGSQMCEDFEIYVKVYDEPLEDRGKDASPTSEFSYKRPDKYMVMYDTLSENEGLVNDILDEEKKKY